ncbi:MAG: hypothetical protein JXN64_09120, partial [Spirochaetes bacterium]|nr:hypothetical protein [Spirochaetota bacterium]
DEKYKFIRKARNMQMSGYNLYLSEYMKDIFAAGSKPAQRPSITDKPDTSGIQRHIHSVSKPFLNTIAPISVINGIINSPG